MRGAPLERRGNKSSDLVAPVRKIDLARRSGNQSTGTPLPPSVEALVWPATTPFEAGSNGNNNSDEDG
jgi:hypothetical protein